MRSAVCDEGLCIQWCRCGELCSTAMRRGERFSETQKRPSSSVLCVPLSCPESQFSEWCFLFVSCRPFQMVSWRCGHVSKFSVVISRPGYVKLTRPVASVNRWLARYTPYLVFLFKTICPLVCPIFGGNCVCRSPILLLSIC